MMENDRICLETALSEAKRAAVSSCACFVSQLSNEKAEDLFSVLEGQLRIATALEKLSAELFG